MWVFVFFCLTQTPRGTHVWQIRPTITGSVCGTPDRLHVTWLSSRTTSYAPVTTAMPRGCSPPPPFKTVDLPNTPLYTQKHRQPPLLYLHLPKKNPLHLWLDPQILFILAEKSRTMIPHGVLRCGWSPLMFNVGEEIVASSLFLVHREILTFGWLVMKFCAGIHGPQRMNL